MANWPDWWSWEIELSIHALDRMIDRDFSETDLRTMLEEAASILPGHEPGRWVVSTRHHYEPWEVILEPVAREHTNEW